MQSAAKTVDEYMAKVPEARREALDAVRAHSREVFGAANEAMTYGMPTYSADGKPAFSWASQKGYMSLYFDERVVERRKAELGTASCGKSCVRYSSPKRMDIALIRSLLEDTRGMAVAG